MTVDEGTRNTRAIVWGVILMALGVLLLLDRLGTWDLPDLWQLWPVTFLVVAVVQFTEGRPGAALTLASVGTWLLACQFHWYGLRYGNSWPLLLVAVGLSIVVRALTGEDRRCCGRQGVRLD